ncbi:MAG TPA: transposase, partial [Candidatus Competibacteraceae bacterium]|nr:transposase [Candidatus Competibacteraceae bacterium]
LWRQVADQLRVRFPRVAALLDEAEDDVLAYFAFPEDHRVKLHSTNGLERLNKEVKRRANVVGIFPNEGSIRRLIGAILAEQNDEWLLQNRYLTLESLSDANSPLTEPAPPALPAAA